MTLELPHLTPSKIKHIDACADARGVIAAVAMDQRGSLQKSIGKARGADADGADLEQFKTEVVRVLTRHSSAVLIDPAYGLPALRHKAPGAGVIFSYENTGYDTSQPGRFPDLTSGWSVRRLVDAGASAIKVLVYFNPWDDARINAHKTAWIERVGAECAALDIPHFLEPLYYADDLDDVALARKKPEAVTYFLSEFSKPGYSVDVLKVEMPFNAKFTDGSKGRDCDAVYAKADVLRFFREAADAAQRPFIFLSAGVSGAVFVESLEWAGESGAYFAGVLCGRATWQGGVPVYATQGQGALGAWLEDAGVRNINALNATLAHTAQPWWRVYGSDKPGA
jgi:tagatose 1,6-diphosphate aldolase